MRRLVCKLILASALVAGAVNYLVYIRTGQSPLAKILAHLPSAGPTLSKLKAANLQLPNMPKVTDLPGLLPSSDSHNSVNTTMAFKWVDKKGVVHYSDSAPRQGEPVKLLKVNPNTNVVQSTTQAPTVSADPQLSSTPAAPSSALPNLQETLETLKRQTPPQQ